MWGTTQNLGPIGSAVLTFIGYKVYIFRFEGNFSNLTFLWVIWCPTKLSRIFLTFIGSKETKKTDKNKYWCVKNRDILQSMPTNRPVQWEKGVGQWGPPRERGGGITYTWCISIMKSVFYLYYKSILEHVVSIKIINKKINIIPRSRREEHRLRGKGGGVSVHMPDGLYKKQMGVKEEERIKKD